MIIGIVLAVSAFLVAVDQLLKVWALQTLAGGPSILVIPGLLQFTYVENRGAAFGIFQGRVGLLSLFTLAVIVVALILLIRGRLRHPLLMWSVGLIIAGGVGNLIDRIRTGVVVDYLNCLFINFPVFNFADVCICVGVGLLVLSLLLDMRREQKAKQQKGSAPTDGTA